MTGRAVVQERAKVKYIETTLANAAGEMESLLRNRDYDFFCLNDGSAPEISIEERLSAVLAFLNSYYPIPAPWEVADVPEAPAADATPGRAPASS